MKKYAFCVAGTQSGCGKTTITLALIAAFKARGLRIQPFKVGPDFIDPGFHTQIAGCESRNLDGWMLRKEYNQQLFRRLLKQVDMAVVEGVMGLFDGYDGISESGSSAEMAKWLGIPVILIVDARSMARSAAALVHGFTRFDPHLNVAGVIFNRVGGVAHLDYLKEAIKANLPDVSILGGIPREETIRIPERHLGLVTADEVTLSEEWRQKLTGIMEDCVDLDLLLKEAQWRIPQAIEVHDAAEESVADLGHVRVREEGVHSRDPDEAEGETKAPVPIAVARDAAFCFYYPDNLELLRASGARIEFFSPLAGEYVPKGSAGVYLGGGYPEIFAERLSLNHPFLDSLHGAASKGMPIYAECGGLMTLCLFIDTIEGTRYPMAGLLPFGTRMLSRRKALGYTEVFVQRSCHLGREGTILRGHEFHYSEITEMEEDPGLLFAYRIQKRKLERDRPEGYMKGTVLASYVHLHWGSNPQAARNFVERCREYMSSG